MIDQRHGLARRAGDYAGPLRIATMADFMSVPTPGDVLRVGQQSLAKVQPLLDEAAKHPGFSPPGDAMVKDVAGAIELKCLTNLLFPIPVLPISGTSRVLWMLAFLTHWRCRLRGGILLRMFRKMLI
jgi:hypothetical protein